MNTRAPSAIALNLTSICPCGAFPRFDTDDIGRTVEICESCGYRGPLRATSREVQRPVRVPATRNRLRETDYKTCRLCGASKMAREFYEDRAMIGGRQAFCKECARAKTQKSSRAKAKRAVA
jgi:hypothetical protein